jgi:hypothetical protein
MCLPGRSWSASPPWPPLSCEQAPYALPQNFSRAFGAPPLLEPLQSKPVNHRSPQSLDHRRGPGSWSCWTHLHLGLELELVPVDAVGGLLASGLQPDSVAGPSRPAGPEYHRTRLIPSPVVAVDAVDALSPARRLGLLIYSCSSRGTARHLTPSPGPKTAENTWGSPTAPTNWDPGPHLQAWLIRGSQTQGRTHLQTQGRTSEQKPRPRCDLRQQAKIETRKRPTMSCSWDQESLQEPSILRARTRKGNGRRCRGGVPGGPGERARAARTPERTAGAARTTNTRTSALSCLVFC